MATLGSITISISPTSGVVDQDFTLNGSTLDTTGLGIATSGTLSAFSGDTSPIPWTSGASGAFTLVLSFTPAATYELQATSGTVLSNTITLVISPSTSPPPPPPVSPPPPGTPILTSISINASSLEPLVGQPDSIIGTAFDQNHAAFVGAAGQITEDGATVAGSQWTSNSSGQFTVPVAFGSPGLYTVEAVSGSIVSDVIEVTVSPSGSSPPPPPGGLSSSTIAIIGIGVVAVAGVAAALIDRA